MIDRYSRPEMANIWTEENKYRAWLEVEILADEGLTVPVLVEGIADRFVEHGTKEQLMKDLALDTESIESAILKRFSQRETQ